MEAIVNKAPKKIKLYEKVANRITRLIDEGTFPMGDRIPSVRKLRNEMKVSITTVTEAYRLLEDRGIIEAHPQSGYYVRAQFPKTISPPEVSKPEIIPTNVCICDFVRMVLRDVGNPDLIQLGSLQPDPDLLPIDRLNLTLSAVVRRNKRKSSLYDELQGYKPLRVQIARRLLSAGCAITPDELIITSGCAETIMLSLTATCEPGDTVAIESPVFFNLL
ncbi:HTH-type transcriptional regulator TauR [subsurface metagenome]